MAESSVRAEFSVKIVPWGSDPDDLTRVARALADHPLVQEYLKETQHRLLSVELVAPEARKTRRPVLPKRYRGTLYDYTNNRTIYVDGSLDDREPVEISESATQPLPSSEEFDEAVEILRQEPEIGPAIRAQRLRPYRPMPPLIEAQSQLPDGRVERIIAVGLLPEGDGLRHEIVGVNMIRRAALRFERRAPEGSVAHNPICGISNAHQPTTSNAAGQAWVTVTQGGALLWRFLVVRPAATIGPGLSTNGTGVELRFVDYRGKRVLYRAHVPILNVKYGHDACGPYRDWQHEEGMLQANGADVVPGFRLCPAPAQTILDTGSDVGNFLGVAIYIQGQEVVLVSEMHAGWYRYISEWRLHTDGTIRPRFGFSAVDSSCVCSVHYHHVYWRLDFDIRTPGNNLVREFNDPCLPGICPSHWHNKNFEIMRFRDPARSRKWRVENTMTGEAYELIPGADDGVATASPDWPFPRGDVWILRYHGTEIDDGVVATGPPYEAGLNSFLNGEPINNQDVVIWYAAHVTHDVAADPPGTFGHIVGPELKLITW